MSSKLKKWIIAGVGFLLVAVIVLVAITMLSGLSTTTVYNLRFVEAVKIEETEEPEGGNPEEQEPEAPSDDPSQTTPSEPEDEFRYVEIFEKDVFLTNEQENQFEVSVLYNASATLELSVASSRPDIATIAENEDETYTIKYFKEGTTTIRVYSPENPSVYDSFVLNVRENTPISFKIIDDPEVNKFALSEDEVYLFADNKDYSFKFDTTLNGDIKDVNISGIYVVKDYNTDVFDDIYIDDATSSLVIRAKQSEVGSSEHITLQSRRGGEDGIAVETFVISVDVRGNYLINIQLCVDSSSDFKTIKNVYGGGITKEGEEKIDAIILTSRINVVNFKVRVVYTNEDVEYVTSDAVIRKIGPDGLDLQRIERAYGEYYRITWNATEGSSSYATANIEVAARGQRDLFLIEFFVDENSAEYKDFANRKLYAKEVDEETGITYYSYVYWDVRFMRDDAIVSPENGKIIGFANGDPTCEETLAARAYAPAPVVQEKRYSSKSEV